MHSRYISYIKRILAALYFFWFILNLGFFFSSNESEDSTAFWPFIPEESTLRETYGLTEFLVYTGVPLIFFIVYKIYTYRRYDAAADTGHHHRKHEAWLGALLREKVRAAELELELQRLKQQPADDSRLRELRADLEKFSSGGLKQWLMRAELRKKYRDEADLQ